jgi:uncharacterized membrane protein
VNWLLAVFYWLHLLATVIWLGGLALMVLVAWPAMQHGSLADNQWLAIQRRFLPWANASLVVLLITGFVQMTNDSNYTGFLNIDSPWAWAILLKHVAFIVLILLSVYLQAFLYPAMTRLELVGRSRPELAETEGQKLRRQEIRFLRLNTLCAALVLLFTAIATAI